MKKLLSYGFALICSLVLSVQSAAAQELTLPVQIPELNQKVKDLATPALDQMLSNPEKATATINKAIKATKNDKGQMMALANWFMQQDNTLGLQGARYVIEKLYSTNAEDVEVLLLAGDIYGTMGQWGKAGQKYDQALVVEPDNIYALTQGARIYKNHNPTVSLSLWEKLKELQPDNLLAARNIGDLLYDQNYMGEALENYGKYYDGTPHTKEALNSSSMERYLISLFFSEGKEARLAEVAKELYKADPNNLVYERFAFIGTMLTFDDQPNALEDAQRYGKYVMSGTTPDSLLLYQDFVYAYQLADKLDDADACVTFVKKAVEKDPEQVNLLKSGAVNLNAAGHFPQAAELYNAFLAAQGDKAAPDDFFNLAVLYRQALPKAATAEEKEAYAAKALELLGQLDQDGSAFPADQKYKVALERARVLNQAPNRDADAVAKTYLQALELCPDEAAAGMELYDAYYVLTFYYADGLQTCDDIDAQFRLIRQYCSKALNLDPTNENLLDVDDVLHSQGY